MKWRNTLFLGMLFLVVAGAFWLGLVKGRESKREETLEKQRLLSGVNRIYHFKIELRGGFVEVAQDTVSKQWNIIAPIFYPSDNNEVLNVIRTALEINFTQIVADNGNPKDFGLAPVPWVKFSTEGKTFLLGDDTPTQTGVYAQIEGDKRILLVPGEYREKLLKGLFDLRDKAILPPIEETNIDSFKLIRKDGEIALVRKGFQWWFNSPINAPADNNLVSNLLSPFINVRALDFAAENCCDSVIKALKLERAGTVLLFAKGSIAELKVFTKHDDVGGEFAFVSTPAKMPLFNVPTIISGNLKKSANELRDRSLTKALDADKFAIVGPKDFMVKGKVQNGEWFIIAPESTIGDRTKIQQFLADIQNTRIDSFVADTRFKLSGWEIHVNIANDSVVYVLGAANDTELQLKRAGEKEYYLVPKRNLLKWCGPDWKKFAAQ